MYCAGDSTAPSATFVAACRATLVVALAMLATSVAAANSERIHGLWVWKGQTVIAAPNGTQHLAQFCRAQDINEIYLSVSDHGDLSGLGQFSGLIETLHRDHIRVEALLSSTEADEPGKHRDKLIEHVREVVKFDRAHPDARFDGIHLDIEPQQRPENKGPGNLQFLPGLTDAYRAVSAIAAPAQLSVNADIQNKLLKGTLAQRRLLLTSLPRLTLMLYELSSPTDGTTSSQKAAKLQQSSSQFLHMAYDGLSEGDLASLVIGLRTPDYADLLNDMFSSLEQSAAADPHYAGWARHAYNDTIQ